MNYIKTLSAVGLKSGDFTHQLGPVNLLVGPSFSGKTSRLDALRLGLVGYVPELGKTGTMALARNGQIKVSLEDAEGRRIEREWSAKNKTGKASGEVAVPPVLMNPNEYFDLSDAKKIQYVFGLYPMEDHPEFSGEAIVAQVENTELADSTEAKVQARRELVKLVDQSDRDRHEAGQTVQEWLSVLITDLKDVRLKEAKAAAVRMAKTVQGITSMQGQAVPLRSPEGKLKTLREQAKEIAEQLGANRKAVEQRAQLEAQKAGLTARLKTARSDRTTELKQEVEKLERELQGLQEVQPDPEVEAEQAKVRTELETLTAKQSAYRSETALFTRELGEWQAKQSVLTTSRNHLLSERTKLEAEYKNAMATECCPTCQTAGDLWKPLLTERHNQRLKEIEAENRRLDKEDASLFKSLAMAEKKVRESKELDAEFEGHRKTCLCLQTQLNAAADKQRQIEQARQAEIRKVQEALKLERLRLDDAKAEREAVGQIEAQLKGLTEQLEQSDTAALETQRQTLDGQADELQKEILALEQQQRDYQKAKAQESANAQALIESEALTAKVEVMKAVVGRLEAVQGRMVGEAFGQILKVVNRLTVGILKSAIEYRDGQLGRWEGQTWVAHETFSGTEKALTYAGLALALAQGSPYQLVMIDELGRLDSGALEKFMERMEQLTREGVVGQFIGCLSHDDPTEVVGPEGVAIIAIGK